MPRFLVAYYSLTGNTSKVSAEIAQRLSADVEVITEVKPRKGVFAALRAVYEAVFDRIPAIKPAARDVGSYDVVILGFPIWAQKAATPMRAYVVREKDKFPPIAGFCTEGGSGGDKALRKLSEQAGKSMTAELIITESELKSEAWRTKVDKFVRALPVSAASQAEPVL